MNPGNRARSVGAIVLLALALAFPASAAAGEDCDSPTGDQYCPKTEVLTGSGSGTTPTDPPDAGGLPFTGFDLGLSIAAGAGLLGAGIALRRASRPRSAAE